MSSARRLPAQRRQVLVGLALAFAPAGCGDNLTDRASPLRFVNVSAGEGEYGIQVRVSANLEGPESCFLRYHGGCEVEECDIALQAAPVPTAGVVTVDAGGEHIELVPDEDGVYARAAGTATLWQAGEEVRIAATGGHVPPFDRALPGPGAPVLIAPASDRPLVVERTRDLEVTFSGGEAGTVVALLAWQEAPNHAGQLRCYFEAEGGAGIIPRELLADLPITALSMLVFGENRAELRTGTSRQIRLQARSRSVVVEGQTR